VTYLDRSTDSRRGEGMVTKKAESGKQKTTSGVRSLLRAVHYFLLSALSCLSA
jgi:hypothetical protein